MALTYLHIIRFSESMRVATRNGTVVAAGDPVQLFDQTWLPIISVVLSVIITGGTAVLLIMNLSKTADIARANQQSAAASARALDEMRAQRDAETAPYVVAYADWRERMVFLVVENLGKTAAHNIALAFEPGLAETLFLAT
jgi:hypothetical protein